jgi:hypothetical protein
MRSPVARWVALVCGSRKVETKEANVAFLLSMMAKNLTTTLRLGKSV